jgi:capsid assembly protease
MNLPFVAQRMLNTPLLILPQKLEVIAGVLQDRLGVSQIARLGAWAEDDEVVKTGPPDQGFDSPGGVAIISVSGTLVQKSGYLRPFSGMTGYDGIRHAYSAALTDPSIKAIVLDIDSPGGEAAGCFDLADHIYANREVKPTFSILSEMACSGGFALASATSWRFIPRTGIAGHVGVVVAHSDMSKALDSAGIKMTIIAFGAHKADGNPYEPLPELVRSDIQAQVDFLGQLFCATMARNLGLTEKQVQNTEARVFTGQDAVDIGFADEVASPSDAFSQILESVK